MHRLILFSTIHPLVFEPFGSFFRASYDLEGTGFLMYWVLVLNGCYTAILFSGAIPRKPHSEDRLFLWGTHGTLQGGEPVV